MCLAGDGGGKGRRKKRRGVDLAGEGAIPGGKGLALPGGPGLGQVLAVAEEGWTGVDVALPLRVEPATPPLTGCRGVGRCRSP